MRLSLTSCRILVPALALALLAGCKSKLPPDQPTVLGTPPATAYLGVDYYYDFGGYGGTAPLQYTLSNAPSWMALEQTTNKARDGIVLHGVPGITGGNRGTADLGQNSGIAITATDGSMLGSGTFSVNVQSNKLNVTAVTATEGQPSAADSVNAASTVCDKGDTTQTGTIQVNVPNYNSDNSVGSPATVTRTFKTYPVLIPITLTKPSVEPVTVAWSLSSNYSPTCKTKTGHDCEFASYNLGHAELNQTSDLGNIDVVGSTGTMASTPSYLQYTSDVPAYGANGKVYKDSGLLTIPAGKSTCFVRVEVVADDLPEQAEDFKLTLNDVRQGLAEIGTAFNTMTINDSSPSVSFSQDSDSISVGSSSTYTATISKAATATMTVPLNALGASTASSSSFQVVVGGKQTNDLVFQPGEMTKQFTVKIVAGSSPKDPYSNDLILDLGADPQLAYGHENYVFAGGKSIAIDINEWVHRLQVGQTAGFVPNAMTVGDNGHVFLAGTDNGKVELKAYDRFSNDVTSAEIPSNALDGTGTEADPYIAYKQQRITIQSGTNQPQYIDRRELALAFNTNGVLTGQANTGNSKDVGVVVLRRQSTATQYKEQWNDQLGSSKDDLVRGVSFDDSGNVYVAGITDGVWPKNSASGGEDAFAVRIDNQNKKNPDGSVSEIDSVPVLNWERQWGSPLNDNVNSAFNIGSVFYVGGTTTGQLDTANHIFGGVDGFFSSIKDQSSAINNFQFGTQYDDNVKAMVGSGQFVYVTGNSVANYVRGSSTDLFNQSLPRLNSENGFIMQLYASGNVSTALVLKDASDSSSDSFDAIQIQGSQVFVGGETNGSFKSGDTASGKDAVLARVDVGINNVSHAEILTGNWRVQQDDGGDEKVIALGLYSTNKLVALVRTGSDQTKNYKYEIRLYKLQDGTELTSK